MSVYFHLGHVCLVYVLSMSFCSGWNSLDVMVVTASGYVTIARRILLYTLYVSALVSFHLLMTAVHCLICSCLKCISAVMSRLGFNFTSSVLSDSLTFFLLTLHIYSLWYP